MRSREPKFEPLLKDQMPNFLKANLALFSESSFSLSRRPRTIAHHNHCARAFHPSSDFALSRTIDASVLLRRFLDFGRALSSMVI
jgi:hypothetical protein